MFERLKGNFLFERLMKRQDINNAYKMVPPTDSWYDTITTVHNSLEQIRKLPHDQLQLISHDGLKLQAIYYPCEGSDKTMIWVHGYTSHAERESAFPGLFYRSLGFNILIPYLRAHGPSQGRYIAFGGLEYRDMMGWVDRINELHPEGSILIHGLSMGGGIALDLATKRMKNVKGLVVDAPSLTVEGIFRHVAQSMFKKEHEKVAEAALSRYEKEFGCKAADFDRVENIKNGLYPLLLSAGSNEHMDELLDQVRVNNPRPTTVVILPGCNHGNGMYKQTMLYQDTIHEFIDKYMTR
jgi:alpha/beta superfamily hydrolase